MLQEAREAQADGTAGAAAKKRKGPVGDAAAAANGTVALELESQRLLAGHSQCVAAVAWPSAGTLVTGSWDHSVRASWFAHLMHSLLRFRPQVNGAAWHHCRSRSSDGT